MSKLKQIGIVATGAVTFGSGLVGLAFVFGASVDEVVQGLAFLSGLTAAIVGAWLVVVGTKIFR